MLSLGVTIMIIGYPHLAEVSDWWFVFSLVLTYRIFPCPVIFCDSPASEMQEVLKSVFLGTLWLFNIAMENGPFIDGLPIKNGDFPWLC